MTEVLVTWLNADEDAGWYVEVYDAAAEVEGARSELTFQYGPYESKAAAEEAAKAL
jgi:hypothetical protein